MNEPKLRFPEFNSNWTHDNLENVAEIFDGTHQTPLYTKTGVQFVSVENIEDIYKSEKYISHEEYDKYRNKPQINDILMTRITAGVIGETAMVTKDAPLAYYVSLALIRCEKLFPSYVEKYIHSIQFRKELYKRIIHTAFPKKINLGDIGKCLVGITNEQEQQKIAEFLSTIDTVIEKQKETVSAWEERKKGVMQKLFSQEVRFKADDGSEFPEWEEKKLSEIASIHARIGWQNLRKDEFLTDGNYLLITGTDFCNGRVNLSTCYYVDKERYEQDKNIQVEDGTILVTKDGTLGKVALVENLNKPATLNAGVFAIKVIHADTISKFLYHWLAAPMLLEYASKKSTGGTIKHLNQGILVDFPVGVPCLEEQQKIADCLSSLDEVIEKQKATLAAWEELKKGLLQQMFA